MNISYMDRANILAKALPYIQKLSGKTIVVKYGGNAMINDELKIAMMSDVVLMKLLGINVVLVHGGGPEINSMLKKIGKESYFIDGLRYTDKETMNIVQMVLAGKINKDLVQLLHRYGGKAIGLCGLDGGLITAKKTKKDLGLVGDIVDINTDIINELSSNGYIPVIATIGGGENGEVYNINADIAASFIAAQMKAVKLVLMTDVKGLLRNCNDLNTLIPVVNVSDVKTLKKEGIINGGMIPKVDCCVYCINHGVSRAHIIDGRIAHSILIELFSDEGIGTMFC